MQKERIAVSDSVTWDKKSSARALFRTVVQILTKSENTTNRRPLFSGRLSYFFKNFLSSNRMHIHNMLDLFLCFGIYISASETKLGS